MPTKELERALRLERRVRRAASDRARRFRWGTARYNTRAPLVTDVNTLEVTRPSDDLTAAALIASAQRLQADLEHRRVRFDTVTAPPLARGLIARGWEQRRFLVMAHRRRRPATDGPEAWPLDPASYQDSHEEFIRGEPYGDEESVAQILLVGEMTASRISTQYFGAGPRGRVVSTCALFSSGKTAQIEDVGTLRRFRGRGYGRAVVIAALAHAYDTGHSLVFLVADADDWPRQLYSRLGFRSVGSYHAFSLGGPQLGSHADRRA